MSYKNERIYGFNQWEIIIIMTVASRILLKKKKTIDTFVENVL